MKGFKYDKFKEDLKGNDSWGSYSDLFMVLSFVFLMMYVVSSLRSGTSSIHQRIEQQKIARENNDLKAQIKAYNTLKDSALKDESQEEQEVYKQLMNKLTLLQDEAREEKTRLRQEAIENEKKEVALNKYQQVVRNIINANLLAKSKLKVREEIIANKNVVITDLNQELESKKSEIENNNKEIDKINNELARNIAKLKKDQERSKITKKKAYEQIARLKQQSQQRIVELNQENQEVQRKLNEINQELNKTSERLAVTESQKKELSSELASTSEKLQKTVEQNNEKIKSMQEAHENKMAQEKAAFNSKLKAAKLTAQEKAKQLAEFNSQVKAKDKAVAEKIAALQSDLADAQERANARAKLSKDIADALKKAGVDADVNANTGDVTIAFGKDYFDNDSSHLKKSMAEVLRKFVPKYSESLFKDPKIANKITSVDIIGFASPTFQGKYIDPQSLDGKDQEAAKYNLDLSYKRARAIFDFMFDTKKISYKNQRKLLPLVKVTGRSFFTEGRAPAGVVPGMGQKDFCKKVDCKQAQRVIIKFNMDDKK
jgi:myosin heavy subunit